MSNFNEKYLYEKLRTFKHHGKSIPEYMHSGIVMYVVYGIQPGDFLTGVLTNDLYKAAMYADDINENLLATYVAFFYNHTPTGCWGSIGKMDSWIIAKQDERYER
jgi:hypothetical protein